MASSSGKSASNAKTSAKATTTKSQPAKAAATAEATADANLFDLGGIDAATLLDWYATMQLGRRLDEKAANYLKMAKGWSYHAPFAGHDGIQLALGKAFRAKKDYLFPYYRDMLTCLAAGLTVEEIIANGLSKDADVAGGGRHMSNHFAKIEFNIQNVSSCTGNHCQQAAGLARAVKKYGGDEVVYCSTGDSTTSEGYYYESVNGADREKLPLIFVIQNNKYGISVPLHEQTTNLVVSDNFRGFTNLKIWNVDGRDPVACHSALLEARAYALSGAGPAMIHADCDRIGSHSNSDNHELYREKEDIDAMKHRDPLPRFRASLLAAGIATEEQLAAIEQANKQAIFAAADVIEPSPDPAPSSYTDFVIPESIVAYHDEAESRWQTDPDAQQITFREGINTALIQEFRRNPNTFLFGQDVASHKKQGIFNVCKGLLDEFGNDRVFNAPIAEDYIVGTANGMCRYRDDIRVVVEGAEFADYFWPAMEQLVECSHDYWRTRGQFSANMVVRLASGGYIQGGLYHSQNLEGTFTTLPGIRVVMPAFADDAVGLMRNAMRSRGVTMYLEPKFLYNYRPTSTSMPSDDFIIPFGKARVRRPGTDLTIVSWGTAVHWSLQAAQRMEAQGTSVEVIDLRSLAPWDKDMVLESVKRTGRCVVAHEDKKTAGFGGEVASTITEEVFRWLDAPVVRVGSKDTPVGFAKSLEGAILLSVDDIVQAATATVNF
ncbi:MAG: 2-oxoisovalerate dehydrogenase [Candidatus Kapabacteria bacterium]|nr:2-oxoisovalerate dehydrogenase [Candidatus Kapabacteria bacterium]